MIERARLSILEVVNSEPQLGELLFVRRRGVLDGTGSVALFSVKVFEALGRVEDSQHLAGIGHGIGAQGDSTPIAEESRHQGCIFPPHEPPALMASLGPRVGVVDVEMIHASG